MQAKPAQKKLRLKIIHKGLAVILLPLILQLGCILWLFFLVQRSERLAAKEVNISNIAQIYQEMEVTSASAFGALMRMILHGEGNIKTNFSEEIDGLEQHLQVYLAQDLGAGSTLQRDTKQRLDRLMGEVKQLIAALEKIAMHRASLFERLNSLGELSPLTNRVGDDLQRLKWYTDQLHDMREVALEEEEAARDQMKVQIFCVVGIEVAMTVLVLLIFLKNISDRLNILVGNAMLIPKEEPLTATVGGGDELAYLDEILHNASKSLQRAAEHKRALMEMVAHDLRSPLMSARLLTQQLIVTAAAPASKSCELTPQLEELQRTCAMVIAFVEDLLTVDRLKAGKLELDWSSVELTGAAGDSIKQITPLAQAKDITLTSTIESVRVIGDRRRIMQVFNNILSNAVKYAPEKSEVKVSSQRLDKQVKVLIADSGPGVPKDQQSKLFEKFYQVDSQDAIKGFGLGLAICNMIVAEHGGCLGVDSEFGQGSVFWFTLPLDED